MKKEGPCAVYGVILLVVVVTVENTLALSGPLGSVCDSRCCDGWDQAGDTCVHCYNPCVHGTCVDMNTCECEPGWEGGDCSNDIDECWYETHACHHNCHNNDGCYSCSCDDGFQLVNSTHCANSTTSTTVGPPQGGTEIPAHCATPTTTVGRPTTQTPQRTTRTTTTATTTADVTTRRPLKTAPAIATEAPGRRPTTLVTGPVVDDNDRSPAPPGGADQQNVDWAVGAAVSALALILLVISGILIVHYKKKKKTTTTAAHQQEQYANLSQPQPPGSHPGYNDMYWPNPAYENSYEEIRETHSPPPPYEATGGYEASRGFAAVAGMPEVDITHKNDVGVEKTGISFAGSIPAFPSNLHVDIQKAPPPQDDGYKPLKKVPGNEYESLKPW